MPRARSSKASTAASTRAKRSRGGASGSNAASRSANARGLNVQIPAQTPIDASTIQQPPPPPLSPTRAADTAGLQLVAGLNAGEGSVSLALPELSVEHGLQAAKSRSEINLGVNTSLPVLQKAAQNGVETLTTAEHAQLAYEIHGTFFAGRWLAEQHNPEVRKIWMAALKDVETEEFYKSACAKVSSGDMIPLGHLDEALIAYQRLCEIRAASKNVLSPRGMAVHLMSVVTDDAATGTAATGDPFDLDFNDDGGGGGGGSTAKSRRRGRQRKKYDYDDDDDDEDDFDDDDDDDEDEDDDGGGGGSTTHRHKKSRRTHEEQTRDNFWQRVEEAFAFATPEQLRLLQLSMSYDELGVVVAAVPPEDLTPDGASMYADHAFNIPELGTHWTQHYDDGGAMATPSSRKSASTKRKRDDEAGGGSGIKRSKTDSSPPTPQATPTGKKGKGTAKSRAKATNPSASVTAMNAVRIFGAETASFAVDVSAELLAVANDPTLHQRIETVERYIVQHCNELANNNLQVSDEQLRAVSQHSINQRLLAALIAPPPPKTTATPYRQSSTGAVAQSSSSTAATNNSTYVKTEAATGAGASSSSSAAATTMTGSRPTVGGKSSQLRPRTKWPAGRGRLEEVTSFDLWNEEELDLLAPPSLPPFGNATPAPGLLGGDGCLPTALREVLNGSLAEIAAPAASSSNKFVVKKTKSKMSVSDANGGGSVTSTGKKAGAKTPTRRAKKGKTKPPLQATAREYRACFDLMRLDVVTAPPRLSGEEAEVGTTLLMDGMWDHMNETYAQRTDDEVCALLRKEQAFLRQQMRDSDAVRLKLYPRMKAWRDREPIMKELALLEAKILKNYKKRKKAADSTIRKSVDEYNTFVARHGDRTAITDFTQPLSEQSGIPDTELALQRVPTRYPSHEFDPKYIPYMKFALTTGSLTANAAAAGCAGVNGYASIISSHEAPVPSRNDWNASTTTY